MKLRVMEEALDTSLHSRVLKQADLGWKELCLELGSSVPFVDDSESLLVESKSVSAN